MPTPPRDQQLTLREARARDRPTLVRFMQEMRDRLGRTRRDEVAAEAWLALMLSVDHDAWLIERGETAIGYVLARENGDHVYIRHFLITPQARRAGAGTEALALLAEEYGGPEFRLNVLNEDADATAFWRELGFAPEAVNMRRAPEDTLPCAGADS